MEQKNKTLRQNMVRVKDVLVRGMFEREEDDDVGAPRAPICTKQSSSREGGRFPWWLNERRHQQHMYPDEWCAFFVRV